MAAAEEEEMEVLKRKFRMKMRLQAMDDKDRRGNLKDSRLWA